jgi:hypothetical protein
MDAPRTQPKSAWWLLVIAALALVTTWGFWFVLSLPQLGFRWGALHFLSQPR